MIALPMKTQETNVTQNFGAFARRYQQGTRSFAGFEGMTQQTNQHNLDTSRRWYGRDYHERTEQVSRKGCAA